MQADLLPYLPEWFRQIKDFEALVDTETKEFEVLAAAMSAVRDNFYIQTADSQTILLYEGLFSIIPTPEESLDFRRARILNRLSIQPPFSIRFLYEKLDQIIGVGKWSVTMDYSAHTLYVESAAENQAWANEVYITLNTIKPCHILYISRPFTTSGLLMAEEVGLFEGEYKYKLGAWGLGLNPFIKFTNKGVIVTKDQKSIETGLLEDVAAFTASDIASVRLNGSVIITDFDEKEATGTTVTVQYTVTNAQAPIITREELLSTDGTVLTSAPVYVPVSSSVQFRHTITTKEGS